MCRLLVVAALICAPATSAVGQASGARQQSSDAMAEVRGLEQKMWDHWKNHELDAMRDLMASDALFVGAQGTSTREQEIEEMKKSSCDVKSVSLQDVHVALASPTVVVITYRSKSEGSCDGKPFPKTGGVNSSVWSRKGGRWLTVLHQQSPATD